LTRTFDVLYKHNIFYNIRRCYIIICKCHIILCARTRVTINVRPQIVWYKTKYYIKQYYIIATWLVSHGYFFWFNAMVFIGVFLVVGATTYRIRHRSWIWICFKRLQCKYKREEVGKWRRKLRVLTKTHTSWRLSCQERKTLDAYTTYGVGNKTDMPVGAIVVCRTSAEFRESWRTREGQHNSSLL